MGLIDSLFKKTRPMPLDGLPALGAASGALSREEIAFSRKAGICLQAPGTGRAGPSRLDLTGLLAGAALPARYELATDEYGCTWIIFTGDLNGVLSAVSTACRLLNDARFGGDILCAAFEFVHGGDRKVYWIYNRKGLFYPFAPASAKEEHDVELEMKMKGAVSDIMRVESAVSNWYPLWGMPF